MKDAFNKKGFTIVEIIVTLAVLGIVIAPLMTMFITSQKINNESSKEYKSIQLAQKYMEEIKTMDRLNSSDYDPPTEADGKIKYTKIIPESPNDYGALIEIESVKNVDDIPNVPVDFDATMTIEPEPSKLVKYQLKDASAHSYIIPDDIKLVINNTGIKIQDEDEITAPPQKKIKVELKRDAKINITNNLVDEEVELYIYNLDNEHTYNCTLYVEKGEVQKINNNSIVAIEKMADNILYNVKITVKKGTEPINTIEGTKIFKYKPN